MFRWSFFVLNPKPASDDIRLDESGTMSLDNSVNQLSNVIDPAASNDSNLSLVNAIFEWEWKQPWLFITMYKGYSQL